MHAMLNAASLATYFAFIKLVPAFKLCMWCFTLCLWQSTFCVFQGLFDIFFWPPWVTHRFHFIIRKQFLLLLNQVICLVLRIADASSFSSSLTRFSSILTCPIRFLSSKSTNVLRGCTSAHVDHVAAKFQCSKIPRVDLSLRVLHPILSSLKVSQAVSEQRTHAMGMQRLGTCINSLDFFGFKTVNVVFNEYELVSTHTCNSNS